MKKFIFLSLFVTILPVFLKSQTINIWKLHKSKIHQKILFSLPESKLIMISFLHSRTNDRHISKESVFFELDNGFIKDQNGLSLGIYCGSQVVIEGNDLSINHLKTSQDQKFGEYIIIDEKEQEKGFRGNWKFSDDNFKGKYFLITQMKKPRFVQISFSNIKGNIPFEPEDKRDNFIFEVFVDGKKVIENLSFNNSCIVYGKQIYLKNIDYFNISEECELSGSFKIFNN